jgi:YHS domain-containing protein
VFATFFWMTRKRGAKDPVCGMTVDRDKAVRKAVGGEVLYFCSGHCLEQYDRGASGHGAPGQGRGHNAHAPAQGGGHEAPAPARLSGPG